MSEQTYTHILNDTKPCSHLTSGFYGNKWWCSYLTFAFDYTDESKTQTQMLSVNKTLRIWNVMSF